MRQVETASAAIAVQIMYTRHGKQRVVEHVGSAHDEQSLAVLLAAAEQRKMQLQGCQQLALEFSEEPTTTAPPAVVTDAQPRMVGTKHRVL